MARTPRSRSQRERRRPSTRAARLRGQVAEIVRSSGVDPATVVLEVTETTLLQNAEDAIAKLEALRELGLGVAIDDFGTGYSSLSYLQRFPATAHQDRPRLRRSRRGGRRQLGACERHRVDGPRPPAEVIAEGVEEPFQLERLRKLRCSRAQGYYLARPLPADELEGLFASRERANPWSRTRRPDLLDLSSLGAPGSAA